VVEKFDRPSGSVPDPAVWVAEVGGGGWGDAQLQTYAAPPANASITADGQLAIVARRATDPADGRRPGTVTSARLVTKDRLTVQFGRVAARIRVPAGSGVWPAVWMLGAEIDEVGWPGCGEIDVMEYVGSDPIAVHGTLHGPGYAGVGGGIGRRHDTGIDLSEAFHTYGVDWASEHISWHVDGVEYFRLTPGDVPGPGPFRHPFYLLVNLAIGGSWPGNDPAGLTLPATMLIDWVRVFDSTVQRSGSAAGPVPR
jgi:beta-glucanase (GH16 family)